MKKAKAVAKPIVKPTVDRKEKLLQNRSDFAQFVTGYRLTHGLSQVDLAEKIGTTKTAVALCETDKFEFPLAFFRALLPILGEEGKQRVIALFQRAVVNELTKK